MFHNAHVSLFPTDGHLSSIRVEFHNWIWTQLFHWFRLLPSVRMHSIPEGGGEGLHSLPSSFFLYFVYYLFFFFFADCIADWMTRRKKMFQNRKNAPPEWSRDTAIYPGILWTLLTVANNSFHHSLILIKNDIHWLITINGSFPVLRGLFFFFWWLTLERC